MVKATGSFTLEKTFEVPEVDAAFKKALHSQGINSNIKVKVQCVSHYDAFKNLKMGNIAIAARMRSVHNVRLNYRIPVVLAYNKEKLGSHFNLTAKKLKKIVLCAIKDKIYEPWKKVPLISIGATRGQTRRAIAAYTGLPYAIVSQVIEQSSDIVKLEDNFVDELINNRGFDLVGCPYPLMKTYFTGDFDISKIDGKYPQESGYKLNNYLLYASYDGTQLETQEAIANAFKDVRLRKELKKVGITHSDDEQRIERLRKGRPDLFEPDIYVE